MSDISEESKVLSGHNSKVIESISVKNIFVISLFIGAVGIIAGIIFNSTYFSIITPLLIMVIYIYLTLTNDTDLPITVIGDSYYYQGFVFTLVALMASLFSLGVNEKVDMNAMVASFGAALVTTIVGLVARLYVTSFSIEAQKRRERLETQIEKSLDKFSGQIDTLTQQVVTSISKVHGQTESTLSETLDSYSAVNNKIINDISTTMENGCSAIESSLKGVSQRIAKIEVSEDVISKPLTNSLSGIVKTMSAQEQQYADINKGFVELSDKLSLQFSNTGTQVERYISKLESAMSETIEAQTASYKVNLNNISEGILTSLGDIKDFKLDVQDSVKVKMDELSSALNNIVDGLNESIVPITKTSDTLVINSSKISDSLSLISDKNEEFSKVMTNSLDISNGVKGTAEEFSNLISNIQKFNDSIVSSITSNDQASSKLRDSANATEVASSQVAKDISEVYKQLSIQVRALRSVS